jgi:hypothetical protein
MSDIAKTIHKATNLLGGAIAVGQDTIRTVAIVRIRHENVGSYEFAAAIPQIVCIRNTFALPEAAAAHVEGAQLMEKPVGRNKRPPCLVKPRSECGLKLGKGPAGTGPRRYYH